MTRFRSLLILGLFTLVAGGYLAAQEKPRVEERSQQYPGSNPHLNDKESIRGGMSLYAGCAASAMASTHWAIAVQTSSPTCLERPTRRCSRRFAKAYLDRKCRPAPGPIMRCCRSWRISATWAPSRRHRRCPPEMSRTASSCIRSSVRTVTGSLGKAAASARS